MPSQLPSAEHRKGVAPRLRCQFRRTRRRTLYEKHAVDSDGRRDQRHPAERAGRSTLKRAATRCGIQAFHRDDANDRRFGIHLVHSAGDAGGRARRNGAVRTTMLMPTSARLPKAGR